MKKWTIFDIEVTKNRERVSSRLESFQQIEVTGFHVDARGFELGDVPVVIKEALQIDVGCVSDPG